MNIKEQKMMKKGPQSKKKIKKRAKIKLNGKTIKEKRVQNIEEKMARK